MPTPQQVLKLQSHFEPNRSKMEHGRSASTCTRPHALKAWNSSYTPCPSLSTPHSSFIGLGPLCLLALSPICPPVVQSSPTLDPPVPGYVFAAGRGSCPSSTPLQYAPSLLSRKRANSYAIQTLASSVSPPTFPTPSKLQTHKLLFCAYDSHPPGLLTLFS